MGTDKALLSVGGRPLATIAAKALLDAGAQEVLAIGGNEEGLRSAGFRWMPDFIPGAGPLSGLIQAIKATPSGASVVVLACDLPFASSSNVQSVVDEVQPLLDRPAVAVPVLNAERQWLHACWTEECREHLEAAFGDGIRAPWRAAAGLSVVELEVPEPWALADADHPEDLPR